MKTGFVGFGEVARVFAAALSAHGAEVAAFDIVEDRVRSSGVPFLPLPELVRRSDYVLSTVTAPEAVTVAAHCAPCLGPGQTYVDLNSTSPPVKVEIARLIEPTGASFVEGAILGAVGASGASTRILTGGAGGREAAQTLTALGLRVTFYSAEIGKASLFKMLRNIFSKGLEALLIELLVAGRRAGIDADLWTDVCDFMAENPFSRAAGNWVRSHAAANERRYHEMKQVTETMREIGLEPVMAAATEEFFRRSRSLPWRETFPRQPESAFAVAAFLEPRYGKPRS